MSYQQYTVQCKQCGKQMNTAFGIVGMTQIADPVVECPDCGSKELVKIADGWHAKESKPATFDAVIREVERLVQVAEMESKDSSFDVVAALRRLAAAGSPRDEAGAFEKVLPEHAASLHITHNQHKAYYEPIRSYLANLCNMGFEADEWLSLEDYEKAIDTDSLWQLQWYPNTPIGFNRTFGSTLANCFAAASRASAPPPKEERP